MKPSVIIAATSSRAYVQAAVDAGFDVIALDAFADADVRAIAKQTVLLKMHNNLLDEAAFKSSFLQLDLRNIHGFLYGSLFDNCPALLAWVAKQVLLIGNAAEVMQAAKDFSFFNLLDSLKIAHPEVRLAPPENSHHWLAKKIGGTGGMHIKPASQIDASGRYRNNYFQKIVVGTSISMLFVADGNTAKLIGFNQQLVAPTDELPYRFAGAVGNMALQPNIHAAFEHAAQMLTEQLGLRGLNNLDAILNDDGLWILELNPRLSATFQLYPNLLSLHMQSCAGSLDEFTSFTNHSNAQLIVYADEAIEVTNDFIWPNWVADIPDKGKESSVKISANAPICSVLAQAEKTEDALTLVLQRAKKLREMLLK